MARKDVLVPGLIAGSGAAFLPAGCAAAAPITPSWAAATLVTAAPSRRRRSWSTRGDVAVHFMATVQFDGRPWRTFPTTSANEFPSSPLRLCPRPAGPHAILLSFRAARHRTFGRQAHTNVCD